ncbi:MAG: hypothetical protein KO206_09440, partial [Methanomicrobiaceae archaeon]|nr:hypothetical protein [Methanomicrobiaceae archaeon]
AIALSVHWIGTNREDRIRISISAHGFSSVAPVAVKRLHTRFYARPGMPSGAVARISGRIFIAVFEVLHKTYSRRSDQTCL